MTPTLFNNGTFFWNWIMQQTKTKIEKVYKLIYIFYIKLLCYPIFLINLKFSLKFVCYFAIHTLQISDWVFGRNMLAIWVIFIYRWWCWWIETFYHSILYLLKNLSYNTFIPGIYSIENQEPKKSIYKNDWILLFGLIECN